MKRVKIIVNPVSGRGTAARILPHVERILKESGFESVVARTSARGDAREFAASADGCHALLCIGGDGTINEVINGLDLRADMPIAIVPTGTGNVLAKEMKIPRSIDRCLEALAKGRPAELDVGVETLNGNRFCMMASAGFDSAVVHQFSVARKGTMHMWQYLFWGIKVIESYAMPHIKVVVDGTTIDDGAGYVLVTNVRSFGGPLLFVPQAKPDDGIFDIFVIRRRRKRDIARFFYHGFMNYLTGMDFRMRDAVHTRGKVVELSSNAMVPLQMDGDAAGFLPARFEIIPSKLRLYVP